MKQMDMKTGEIVDVPYVPKADIVVVFEPNRPSYELHLSLPRERTPEREAKDVRP